MIQRIQTLYLFLATAVMTTELFTPVIKSSTTEGSGIYQDGIVYMKENMPAFGLSALGVLISFIAIFLYKNRKIQKTMVVITILIILASNLTSGLYFLAPTQSMMAHSEIVPGIAAFMPIVGIIALALAYRGITKDEKIVKSMDRLR